jgi:hypothetical protein
LRLEKGVKVTVKGFSEPGVIVSHVPEQCGCVIWGGRPPKKQLVSYAPISPA